MKAVERERRDAQVVRLFLGGASYRSIAGAVGLRSPQSVGNIVARALDGSSQRRELLTDEAMAVWQERWERLWRAHWPRALDGDYRSAELCRKLLAQFALVYGLSQEVSLKPSNMGVVEVDPDTQPGDDENVDVLERLRRDRARATGA